MKQLALLRLDVILQLTVICKRHPGTSPQTLRFLEIRVWISFWIELILLVRWDIARRFTRETNITECTNNSCLGTANNNNIFTNVVTSWAPMVSKT